MLISELFTSIQGESTLCGKLCFFIRLHGCNLRCGYCDSAFSYEESPREIKLDDLIIEAKRSGSSFVTITGGEPLLHKETPELCNKLLSEGYLVSLETNGSLDISAIPSKVKRIVDIKTPGSGMESKNRFENISLLTKNDEIKFVITSKRDFEYSEEIIKKYNLLSKCEVLFSPAVGLMNPAKLSDMIIEKRLNVRLNLQLHKILYGEERCK